MRLLNCLALSLNNSMLNWGTRLTLDTNLVSHHLFIQSMLSLNICICCENFHSPLAHFDRPSHKLFVFLWHSNSFLYYKMLVKWRVIQPVALLFLLQPVTSNTFQIDCIYTAYGRYFPHFLRRQPLKLTDDKDGLTKVFAWDVIL